MGFKHDNRLLHLGIFSAAVLVSVSVGYVFSPVSKTSAETVNIKTDVGSSISLNLDKSALTLNGNANTFVYGYATASVSTNSSYGYTLAMEDADNVTDLVSAISEDRFTSTFSGTKTQETMDNNNWGFSLNEVEFYKIPAKNSPVALKKVLTYLDAEADSTTISIGAKIGPDITSGQYQDQLLFSAYVNGVDGSPEGVDPDSDEPEEISDETPEPYDIGEGANENKLVLLKSMQDPKLKKYCSESYTPTTAGRTVAMTRYFSTNSAPRAVVKDVRDGNKYLITKLADGNCWMTQNLALDLDASETLTADTTDLNTKESWTPATSTYMTKVSWGNNATAVSDSVRSFHPESEEAFIKGGTAASESPTEDIPSYLWEKNGNYYNWKAATAGTGSSGSGWTTINDSICPKGWKLPGWDANDKSFWSLLSNTYGLGSYGGNDMITTPFNFIRSGRITWNNGVLDRLSEGYFWTNTSRGGDAGNLLHHTGYISQNAQSKAYGLSVRCVAR